MKPALFKKLEGSTKEALEHSKGVKKLKTTKVKKK